MFDISKPEFSWPETREIEKEGHAKQAWLANDWRTRTFFSSCASAACIVVGQTHQNLSSLMLGTCRDMNITRESHEICVWVETSVGDSEANI